MVVVTEEEVPLAVAQMDRATLTHHVINAALRRGDLSDVKARRGASALRTLAQHGFKLTGISSLRALPRSLWSAARDVCGILYEVRGVDPKPYLWELERLDALNGLDAVRRWRDQRVSTLCYERSPVDRAWIEANGY